MKLTVIFEYKPDDQSEVEEQDRTIETDSIPRVGEQKEGEQKEGVKRRI
jgi:hypothetical protein